MRSSSCSCGFGRKAADYCSTQPSAEKPAAKVASCVVSCAAPAFPPRGFSDFARVAAVDKSDIKLRACSDLRRSLARTPDHGDAVPPVVPGPLGHREPYDDETAAARLEERAGVVRIGEAPEVEPF